MATYEEISLVLPDGYRAYARFWPAPNPKGAVLYFHGIQSHCGWYETSAAALGEAGFAVLQPDRRGSGRNEVDRGHGDSAQELIADAFVAREELLRRSQCPDYHIVGVSWGGKLAAAAHATDADGVRSLSLVTPGLFPLVGVSSGQKFRIGMAMASAPHKQFDIPLNDADLFTAEPKWNRYITEDALTLREATAGFYLASRRMDKLFARLGKAPPVPLHLFMAEDERIIDNDATAQFVRDLQWPNCRISTYDGARHSLEFEPPPCTYVADLVKWIGEAVER